MALGFESKNPGLLVVRSLFHVCVVQDVSPRLPCLALVTAITPNVMNPDPSGIISSNKLLLL